MNPFEYGVVVSGESFCRRPELEKALKAQIASGQNLVVQGERRIGKTSLIEHVIKKFFKQHLIVDLRGVRTLEEVLNRLLFSFSGVNKSRLLKAASNLGEFKASFSLGVVNVEFNSAQQGDSQSLQSIFSLIDALPKKSRTVVFMDEFQDILRLDDAESTLGAMRSAIQRMRDVTFIFAGSSRNEMFNIFQSPNSAFYKGAKLFDIGPVERERLIPFLNEKFLLERIKPTASFWDEVFRITAEVTGDVQQFCSAAWDISSKGSSLRAEDVESCLQKVFAEESRAHEFILNRLSTLQANVLFALATNPTVSPTTKAFIDQAKANSAASVVHSLKAALTLGVLFRNHEGAYQFSSPFFREWLIRQRR